MITQLPTTELSYGNLLILRHLVSERMEGETSAVIVDALQNISATLDILLDQN